MEATNGDPPDRHGPSVGWEGLLAAYLNVADEKQSQELAAKLIAEYASTTIRSSIRLTLGFGGSRSTASYAAQEAEDLYSEAVYEILRWLTDLKSSHEAPVVRSFPGLAATISYRACARYLRRADPNRASLVKKIRYHLTSNSDFDLWLDASKQWICGFAKWRSGGGPYWNWGGRRQTADAAISEAESSSVFDLFRRSLSPVAEARIEGIPELLVAVFGWACAPMRLDDLINIGLGFNRMKELVAPTGTFGGIQRTPEHAADPGAELADRQERRERLRQTWAEIKKLPSNQRYALLLNLRDPEGEGAIACLCLWALPL
jgi:DNA-directed RNA polymerase specialized sigma24 family protein